MAYNSAYKGSEIDAAVGAVKSKEKTWDGKMPAVTGTAGQMVGFDSDGNPVAQDVPATGLTEEEADAKYLKLTGGTVTGDVYFSTANGGYGTVRMSPTDSVLGMNKGIEFDAEDGNGKKARLKFGVGQFNVSEGYGSSIDFTNGHMSLDANFVTIYGETTIENVVAPTTDTMPANKAYVDSATSDAIPKLTIVTLPASGWDSSTKSQTIAVAGVDADETKQWIECTGCVSNQSAFDDASIKITAFAADSLTFTASTVPTVDLKVGVKIEAIKDVTPYPNVFGVCWDYGNSSTALTRLTKANDPNKVVTVDIAAEPSPAVGTASGSSPFDNYAPWKNMDEYNIVDNAVKYRKGDTGFSRTDYDTMVYIPEYWYKIVDDAANSKRYFYIAEKAVDGFEKHPGSGKYVGRYNTNSGYMSKSGTIYLTMTRAEARTNSKSKGDKWSQYDFASWCAVWLLYLVEFADWDSQSKVGCGDDGSIRTGGTDSMIYHTGCASNTNGKTAVQYRHIECIWGTSGYWIDGVNLNSDVVYVCTNPANYADNTASNYTKIGAMAQSNGYIKNVGMATAAPWAFFPTDVGGSETTYIPDYAYYGSGWNALSVSGSGSSKDGGIFFFDAYRSPSELYGDVGSRLLFHP